MIFFGKNENIFFRKPVKKILLKKMKRFLSEILSKKSCQKKYEKICFRLAKKKIGCQKRKEKNRLSKKVLKKSVVKKKTLKSQSHHARTKLQNLR